MNPLKSQELVELLENREAPCLSLYQPTHRSHPENQQDPIRFKNLVKALEESLRQKYPGREVRPLLEPFHALASDTNFWAHTLDGLAVFGAPGYLRAYQLQRPVPALSVVAESFHAKPLVRILQSSDRYQVLAVTRKWFKVYSGNRDVLDEIPLGSVPRTLTEILGEHDNEAHKGVVSAGRGQSVHHGSGSRKDETDIEVEKFFRAADRSVIDHVSKPSGLPLLLVALSENQAPFRKVSHNAALLDERIDADPEPLNADAIRQRAWAALEPRYLARLASIVEAFGTARSKQAGSDDVSTIADAAVQSRVATLLVEADRHDPGRINPETGRIERENIEHPEVDDLLDDLAELVLRKGGDVVVVPADRMPTKSGAAAIFRF